MGIKSVHIMTDIEGISGVYCREAEQFIPNVVTAQVKKATSDVGALLLPPQKA